MAAARGGGAARPTGAERWRLLHAGSEVDRICFPPPPAAFAAFGARSVIAAPARVQMPERIRIGDDTVVHEHVWFSLVESFPGQPPSLRIGNRCQIGRACMFSIVGEVIIEDDVVISDTVHVSDTYHRYDVAGLSARQQPMKHPEPVRIERGAMLNHGAMVLRGVTIGANAFVHAGSVVTRDVPRGAVVMGNPAQVVARGSTPWA